MIQQFHGWAEKIMVWKHKCPPQPSVFIEALFTIAKNDMEET